MVRYRSPTEVKLRKYRMNQQEIKKNLKRKKKKRRRCISECWAKNSHAKDTGTNNTQTHTQTVLL